MIVVIPFNSADWQRAERLLDLIYWLNQKPVGCCLLVADNRVHPEHKLKVRLAAEVAFSGVDDIEVAQVKNASKTQQINAAFRRAARHISECYSHPWLWLESDSVPIKPTWYAALEKAYKDQPRKFMGRHMKGKTQVFMSRTGIYPVDAIHLLDGYCAGDAPFERVAQTMKSSTNTGLIHIEKWSPGMEFPVDVVLVNGDRTGALVESLIEQVPVNAPKPRGRPRKTLLSV